MKVVSSEKIINFLSNMKKYLPSKNGLRPKIFFASESIDYLIELIKKESIEIDIGTIKKGGPSK